MASVPRYFLLSIALACLLTHSTDAKTVFRRTDKISDNFKQLNLPAEEIDPNVAPPEPQKVETIDPEDVNGSTSGPSEEVVDEVEEAVGETSADANDLIDDTINEVDTGSVAASPATVAPAAAAAAAAAASPSSSAAASSGSATPAASTPVANQDDPNAISKYCKCTDSHCDCCRDFGLPLIPVRGPGCAKITYLGDQKMSVSIKYGDITLATRTISGKKARPICVGLPGGYSQFCGRIYGLSKAKENFKACLGFELRADDDVEASLRVSCFKFGPEGLRVADPEPLPSEVNKEEDEDDDDIFGFAAGGGDDEEDDYDDEEPEEPEEADSDDDEADDDDYPVEEAPADADYGGFSLGGLIDELTDDDEEETTPVKPAVTPAARTPAAGVDATRAVKKKASSSAQSKDDKGTETAAAVATISAESSGAVSASVEEAVAGAATPAPVSAEATTVKSSKKSKKSKKNKRKKAANPDTESGFAYEILSGILDFFN